MRSPRPTATLTVVAAALAALTLVVASLAPAPSLGGMAARAQEPATVTDAAGDEVVIDDASRVATLGGVVTEVAYALGAQDLLVAVDDSSSYPPEALATKPTLGYYRDLSAEAVLASAPSLIIGNEETGPAEVVAQLRDAGVTTLLLPDEDSVQGARDLIVSMGRALGRDAEAARLVAALDADVSAAEALVAQTISTPRVLFILRPPAAPNLVAGAGTAAGAMIELAGGENVYPGFTGYIPMTPEGIVEIAPEVILTTDDSLAEVGGLEAFLAQPGIAQTPAAAAGRIVSMDDLYLLGFGPRTGRAIVDLARLLHPELSS
jgi:iron complex transport system substrate-binding protein